jgi:hypothetical protein
MSEPDLWKTALLSSQHLEEGKREKYAPASDALVRKGKDRSRVQRRKSNVESLRRHRRRIAPREGEASLAKRGKGESEFGGAMEGEGGGKGV